MPTKPRESGACLLIDDSGRVRRWRGRERGAAFGYRDPDFDLEDYAVRNLGHVMVEERTGFMRIRLRPLFVGRRTGAAVSTYLAQRAPDRVGLSVFDDVWHHALFSFAEARQRLEAILTDAECEQPAPLMAARRNLPGILDDPRDPFAPVLRRWLEGTYPETLPSFLDACGLYERAMIAERETDSGDFVFRHSGDRIQLYGPSWPKAAVGRRLQDQPDSLYGQWIAEACRSVDDRQVPRYELIAARVRAAGQPARAWRYERLMLPWRSAAGRRLVVSISRRERAEPSGG